MLLMAKSCSLDLDELTHQVEHFSGQYELMLSRSKCCIMHMQASADIHICDTVPLPKAHEAVQLGNNSSHTISIRHEVSKDIQAVKRTCLVEATFVLERCERRLQGDSFSSGRCTGLKQSILRSFEQLSTSLRTSSRKMLS